MDAKLKHLELIQGIVNRLANNSSQLKTWSVTLVAALLVLLNNNGELRYAAIAMLPILVIWGLDGYYLWQERLFRGLYDHVRKLDVSEIDFSMNITVIPKKPERTWFRATFSVTLVNFYGAEAAVLMLITAAAKC